MSGPSLQSPSGAPILAGMWQRLQLGLSLWCAFAMALRITGMHMHVGDELDAMTGVHIAGAGSDREFHHLHGHQPDHVVDGHAHTSVDIGVSGSVPGKQSRLIGEVFAWLPLLALLLLILPRDLATLPLWRPPPSRSTRLLLLPPLRGPPLHA